DERTPTSPLALDEPRSLGEAAAGFAAAAGWPLLADPLSGGRRGDAAVAHYDLLLRARAFTESARPDLVLRLGDLPTSDSLRCCPRRAPCSSPPRCPCARSSRSGRCAPTRRACSATAAPTASTAPCRRPSARPRTAPGRSCC